MVMLGDLLDAGGAADALPPGLVNEIAALPASPEAFAREALLRFERHAPAEEWATVMSRLASAADPRPASNTSCGGTCKRCGHPRTQE
jgi:hypothetical protein